MRHLLFILLYTSLIACSADKEEKATGVIPEHQLKAIDEAKAVEDLMKKKLEEANKTIQDATE